MYSFQLSTILVILCFVLLDVGCSAREIVTNKARDIPKGERNSTGFETKSATRAGEQTSFHMEEGIKNPITIPDAVFQIILANDSNISRSCKEKEVELNSCFVGSQINLDNDRYPDIIVMGQGRMRGANVTGFWIFRIRKDKPELLLETSALQLVISIKKTKSYFDIDTVGLTAVEIIARSFKFNGENYQLVDMKREKI